MLFLIYLTNLPYNSLKIEQTVKVRLKIVPVKYTAILLVYTGIYLL